MAGKEGAWNEGHDKWHWNEWSRIRKSGIRGHDRALE